MVFERDGSAPIFEHTALAYILPTPHDRKGLRLVGGRNGRILRPAPWLPHQVSLFPSCTTFQRTVHTPSGTSTIRPSSSSVLFMLEAFENPLMLFRDTGCLVAVH